MNRRSMLAWLALGAPAAQARGDKSVALGPGLMTFPEIARALATTDRRIRCAPDLAHAAAYVRLKPRPFDGICALLADAFDVRLSQEPEGSGNWVLRRDPEISKRERHWRKQLLAPVEKEFRDSAARYMAAGKTDTEDAKALQNAVQARAILVALRQPLEGPLKKAMPALSWLPLAMLQSCLKAPRFRPLPEPIDPRHVLSTISVDLNHSGDFLRVSIDAELKIKDRFVFSTGEFVQIDSLSAALANPAEAHAWEEAKKATAAFRATKRGAGAAKAEWLEDGYWVEEWVRSVDGEALIEIIPIGTGRASTFAPEGEWSAVERDGVLLIQNRFAFIDRVMDYPTAALVILARAIEADDFRKDPKLWLPTLTELKRYRQDAARARSPIWVWHRDRGENREVWRRADLFSLDMSLTMLASWEALPEAERRKSAEEVPGNSKYLEVRIVEEGPGSGMWPELAFLWNPGR